MNVLQQLQTIQNARFAQQSGNSLFGQQTGNSIMGALEAQRALQDGLMLYDGANMTVKQEGLNKQDGDRRAAERQAEAERLRDEYRQKVATTVSTVTQELEDAAVTGELDLGSPSFAKNKQVAERAMKVVAKADKALGTTTPNPVAERLDGSTPSTSRRMSASRKRFESTDWANLYDD